MGFLNKRKRVEEPEVPEMEGAVPDFIDLGRYKGTRSEMRHRGVTIRMAEISGFEDLRSLSSFIYDGNILIIDFTSTVNDELALKRIISELKRQVEDTGGDMVGIAQTLLLIAPKNISIDKNKLRKGSF